MPYEVEDIDEEEIDEEDAEVFEDDDGLEIELYQEDKEEPIKEMRGHHEKMRQHGDFAERQGRHHGKDGFQGHHRSSYDQSGEHHGKHQKDHGGKRGHNGSSPAHKRVHKVGCCFVSLASILLIGAHFLTIRAFKHHQELHAINTGKKVACSSAQV
jgi:hypothetical protein